MPRDFNDHEFCFAEIDSQAPDKVQLMRVIKAEHGFYGSIKLDKDDLRKFKENFDTKKRRTEIAVDYSHMSHLEAAGWIKDIELREDDTELWIEVEWTKDAKSKIEDKQYKYLSADFSMKYIDEETGEVIGQMLHGAGLTNRPFIRGMNAILSEFNSVDLSPEQVSEIRKIFSGQFEKPKEKENKMNFEQFIEEAKKLSDDQKSKLAEALGVKQDDKEAKKLSDDAAKTIEAKDAEIKKLKEDAAKNEKEKEFNALLSSGKAVEAQRDAFLSGDVTKFAELSQDINLEEKGSSGDEGKDDEAKTPEDAAAKLSEIAEEIAEKEGLEFGEAMSKAIRENEKLYELSEKVAA